MDGGQPSGLCSEYVDPVRRLLSLGEPENDAPAAWTDYVAAFGLDATHVDALIEMARDAELHASDYDSPQSWAPVHAWRALGQLRATAAVAPLLTLLQTLDDDAAIQDMPMVFGSMGPAAIPLLAAAGLDRSRVEMVASLALSGLKEIAIRNPACRDECVGLLARVLTAEADADSIVRGFAVSCLIDLRAIEVTGFWANYNAVGGGTLLFPNGVAGIGSSWGTSTRGYADNFQNINIDHGSIGSYMVVRPLLGVH